MFSGNKRNPTLHVLEQYMKRWTSSKTIPSYRSTSPICNNNCTFAPNGTANNTRKNWTVLVRCGQQENSTLAPFSYQQRDPLFGYQSLQLLAELGNRFSLNAHHQAHLPVILQLQGETEDPI
jgi:hypothetical protein